MEKNNGNNAPFKAEDVNWEELAGIGILKDELEMSGELETLLSGKKSESNVTQPCTPRCGRGDGCHPATDTQGR